MGADDAPISEVDLTREPDGYLYGAIGLGVHETRHRAVGSAAITGRQFGEVDAYTADVAPLPIWETPDLAVDTEED